MIGCWLSSLCVYGLSASEVCKHKHKRLCQYPAILTKQAGSIKDLLSYGIMNISLLYTACLHHKCSFTKSYFFILAMHKLEWEKEMKQVVVRREHLPPNPSILKNLLAYERCSPPPLFSLIVFPLTSVWMWPECTSSSHRNACYTGYTQWIILSGQDSCPSFLFWYSSTVQDLVYLAHMLSSHIII